MLVDMSQCSMDAGVALVNAKVDAKTKNIIDVSREYSMRIGQSGVILIGDRSREEAIATHDGPTIVLVDCGSFIQIHDAALLRK